MARLDTSLDLSALFSQQVQATPFAVAVEDGEISWTYAELDKVAQHVATRLRSSFGVGRDTLVGVLMDHSVHYVLACLAALKAGGAFLVLETAYPPGLLAEVIEDANPPIIIASPTHAENIPANVPRMVLPNDMTIADYMNMPGTDPTPNSAEDVTSGEPLAPDVDLDRLAFVSYSSGSTGRPKGICNPHSAPVRSYDLRFRFSDLQPGDRVACNVFFVWEILRPLLRGATTVTVPDRASYDPVALVSFLASQAITETLMTPTLLATVLTQYPDLGKKLPDLKTLWLNGEVVTVDLARRASATLPNVRLLNCYSASETHEIACCDLGAIFPTDAAICPVGRPLDPEHTYLLGDDGQKVAPGISGELYVGGQLLARGYLNRPDTTRQAFLPDNFDKSPGARMYRTGDRARMLPSGELEISGRLHGMIKLRGYTVQPPKVENAIIQHLAVRSCVVVSTKEGIERQLVAYVVPDENAGNRPSLVVDSEGHCPLARRLLSQHLAHYMVPTLWVQLDTLPTHKVSGKVDVKSLPLPRAGPSPPETPPLEKAIRLGGPSDPSNSVTMEGIKRHWSTCLGVDIATITSHYDFFDLGGHSLALADLASKLSKSYHVLVPLPELVRTPTLRGHFQAVVAALEGSTPKVDNGLLLAKIKVDSVLPDDIQSCICPGASSEYLISEAQGVFLTGVTGFLGAFLLDVLVKRTTATIFCLVRHGGYSLDGAGSAALARLRKHMLELGLWQDSMIDRIEIVPGDLSLPKFGLPAGDFRNLASRVQAVVHAGAMVNLVYSYDSLRDANVNGTKEVLRLAALGQASLHYVSTNGVLPCSAQAWKEDASISAEDAVESLQDGYGQSKWVSEQLVLEAARRGLAARIYRAGTLSGHSVSGTSNPRDLVMSLIVESLRIRHAPNINGWLLEMTPVDFVSNAIVALADSETAGQAIFHLGDPEAVSAKEVFGQMAEIGYPSSQIEFVEWVALWTAACQRNGETPNEVTPANVLRSGLPTINHIKAVVMLDDTKTKAALESSRLRRPRLDLDLLRTYARHFYSRGWLAKAPSRAQDAAAGTRGVIAGPLAGRVAVVTGASSGIGAAVAKALAKEGAHVAVASRRSDKLKELQLDLENSYGVKVLAQQTDVTDAQQVTDLFAKATDVLGPVDIVVVCAGVMYFTMMANVQTKQWDQTVDVNCKGLLHCLASAVPSMLSRNRGQIVAISSDAGRKVFPGLGVYSGSKFFVEAVLQSLRLETAGTGLRVTSIQPGNTDTGLLDMSTDGEAVKKYGTPSGAQVLSPEDVAGAVIYALRQPEHVAVNEVLIEPRDEPV